MILPSCRNLDCDRWYTIVRLFFNKHIPKFSGFLVPPLPKKKILLLDTVVFFIEFRNFDLDLMLVTRLWRAGNVLVLWS